MNDNKPMTIKQQILEWRRVKKLRQIERLMDLLKDDMERIEKELKEAGNAR